MSYVASARASRGSNQAIRVKYLNLRSRDRSAFIFVFEGDDDVAVYEHWCQVVGSAHYEPLPLQGKSQVLGFRSYLHGFSARAIERTLFFVDRDYDGIRGHALTRDLFCTKAYSIENYLVSPEVVRSILRDEFKCAKQGDSSDAAVLSFHAGYASFLGAMSSANLRIFTARRERIDIQIEDSVKKYVTVGLSTSTPLPVQNLLALIPSSDEGSLQAAVPRRQSSFWNLDPALSHRGKFAVGFLRLWLDLLALDRTAPVPKHFHVSVAIKFSGGTLTLRSLAGRSKIPRELKQFFLLNGVCAPATLGDLAFVIRSKISTWLPALERRVHPCADVIYF